jgi:hypothetical protein
MKFESDESVDDPADVFPKPPLLTLIVTEATGLWMFPLSSIPRLCIVTVPEVDATQV